MSLRRRAIALPVVCGIFRPPPFCVSNLRNYGGAAQGDSRQRHEEIADNSVDLSFMSPPYLNHYNYADRTRLETYFWGDAKTWGDTTRNVRTKLILKKWNRHATPLLTRQNNP